MLETFFKESDAGSRSSGIRMQIVDCLLRHGNLPIPDMAKVLKYSVPTVTKYVFEMCEAGLLRDFGKVETREGRHPNAYGLHAEACYFVGVDFKWFSFNIGLMNFAGELVEVSEDASFRFENTPEKLDEVCRRIGEFIAGCGVDARKILHVNVNISGRVNPYTGSSYSIFNFEERPLAEVISARIGCRVSIDNDTRAMTCGEYSCREQSEGRNMIFVNASWGIGIGLIIDGELYCGKSGYAGEFGHMSVYNNEIMCHCGKKGCLETEASGAALHRKLLQHVAAGEMSVLSHDVLEGREVTLPDIVGALAREDMLCIELVEGVGREIGKQIANLINIFNPELVVIGGTLAGAGDYLMQPIKTAIRKYSLNLVSGDSRIMLSTLRDRAGVVGACLLARRQAFGRMK